MTTFVTGLDIGNTLAAPDDIAEGIAFGCGIRNTAGLARAAYT